MPGFFISARPPTIASPPTRTLSMSLCRVHSLPYRPDPASYFALVRHAPGAVLLDAGRPQAERGRYDLLSAWPLATYAAEAHESGTRFFQRLRAGLDQLGRAEAPDGCRAAVHRRPDRLPVL